MGLFVKIILPYMCEASTRVSSNEWQKKIWLSLEREAASRWTEKNIVTVELNYLENKYKENVRLLSFRIFDIAFHIRKNKTKTW